jgi:hypothetical protein
MGSPMANGGINAQEYARYGMSAPPRWWHDLKLMWAGASTIALAALAFWNLGGSTLFTYSTRIAVVETQVASDAKVEAVRVQLDGRINRVDDRTARVEDRAARIEDKVDNLSIKSTATDGKVDVILIKLDQLAGQQQKPDGQMANASAPAAPSKVGKKAAKRPPAKSVWQTITGAN